jgi:hypothetical protein
MAAIDLLVPLSLDLFGRAFEAGDRQRPLLLIGSFNREIFRWRWSFGSGLGHEWQPAMGKVRAMR